MGEWGLDGVGEVSKAHAKPRLSLPKEQGTEFSGNSPIPWLPVCCHVKDNVRIDKPLKL